MAEKVFSAFDDRKGPVPVFATFENEKVRNKVAVKSIVSTLSAREGQDRVEGEAIIPFPEEDMLGFIYYVSLDQKTQTGDFRTISLTYLIPINNSNELYANAGNLSKSAKEVGKVINESYVYGDPIPDTILDAIKSWGVVAPVEKKPVKETTEKKFNLFDLFNLFPPETGFRKYSDPIGSLILAFLQNIPVVLSGPDKQEDLLIRFTEIMQQIYPLKRFSIIEQDILKERISQNASNEPQSIPRADIIILTDELYKKSFFSRDPIVILTTYQELKLPYHSFNDVEVKVVSEWLKPCRENNSLDPIVDKLKKVKNILRQLVYLTSSKRSSNLKELSELLTEALGEITKDEIEMFCWVMLRTKRATARQLNKLIGSKKFEDIELKMTESIGMINL